MSVIDTIRAWFSSDQQQSVDTEYLHDEVNYQYIQTTPDDRARCNICGKWFGLSEMPKVMRHVSGHDGQGQAEINPIAEEYEIISDNTKRPNQHMGSLTPQSPEANRSDSTHEGGVNVSTNGQNDSDD